jgi:CrcB protein
VKTALLVALGGALGSVARWKVQGWVAGWTPASNIPWGTFAVNAVGSFAIGAVLTLALDRAVVSPNARLFLATGILGGFTTFSAFSWESFELMRDGHWPAAALYVGGSLATGLLAALAGASLAARI